MFSLSLSFLCRTAAYAALAFVLSGAGVASAQASAQPVRFGYTIVWVKDVDTAVLFYKNAFDLGVKRRQDMGNFLWAEVATGATTLAFAGEAEIRSMFPSGYSANDITKGPNAAQLSFVTADVEGAFQRAVKAGAKPISSPAKMPWGQVWAQLCDPNGVLLSIASPMEQ
jgi:lactoylglutathione lyase